MNQLVSKCLCGAKLAVTDSLMASVASGDGTDASGGHRRMTLPASNKN